MKWLVKRVEIWKEATVDFLIVESGILKKRLSHELGRGGDCFVVAHNAVNTVDFESGINIDVARTRRDIGLPVSDFIAVFVGSYAWYQGVELLVEAVAMNNTGLSPPMRAVLVGDGPGKRDVERRTRELGVEKRVDFIGKIPHEMVPKYLAAANAAVLPDCTDVIAPIKVLEYMAMGIPAVVPDYEANREVIKHDHTGLLFAPRDASALHAQLRRVQQNPSWAIRIGEAGRERVREGFSWESTWGRALEEIWSRTNGKA